MVISDRFFKTLASNSVPEFRTKIVKATIRGLKTDALLTTDHCRKGKRSNFSLAQKKCDLATLIKYTDKSILKTPTVIYYEISILLCCS